MTRWLLIAGLVAGAMISTPGAGHAVGIWDDPGRLSDFIRSPYRNTLGSQAYRIHAPTGDASMFNVNVDVSIASKYLLRGDLPFVTIQPPASGSEIIDGIGDFRFRAKRNMFAGDSWALPIYASVRTGSGKNTLYPYSTGSVDFELGVAFADTTSIFNFWLLGSATAVTRVHDQLADQHENFLTGVAGVLITAGRVDIEGGALGYRFKSGRVRGLLFTDATWRAGEQIALYVTFQGEVGDERNRVIDWALGFGVEVTF